MAEQASGVPVPDGTINVPTDVAAMRSEFWAAAPNVEMPREVVAAGLSYSVALFEKKAIEGGGPPYRKFGRRCLYRKGDVIAWLDANSQRVQSTSQLKKLAP